MTQPVPQQSIALSPKEPRVLTVITSGSWSATLSGILQGNGQGAIVPNDEVYQIGAYVPGTGGSPGELTIRNMTRSEADGSVDVFAEPTGQNPLAAQQVGIIFHLSAPTIKVVMTYAQRALWTAIQKEQGEETVAALVSHWLEFPIDLVLEHFDQMHQEMEGEGEEKEPAPVEPPNGAGTAEPGAPS
jgi:hypothetical protein